MVCRWKGYAHAINDDGTLDDESAPLPHHQKRMRAYEAAWDVYLTVYNGRLVPKEGSNMMEPHYAGEDCDGCDFQMLLLYWRMTLFRRISTSQLGLWSCPSI